MARRTKPVAVPMSELPPITYGQGTPPARSTARTYLSHAESTAIAAEAERHAHTNADEMQARCADPTYTPPVATYGTKQDRESLPARVIVRTPEPTYAAPDDLAEMIGHEATIAAMHAQRIEAITRPYRAPYFRPEPHPQSISPAAPVTRHPSCPQAITVPFSPPTHGTTADHINARVPAYYHVGADSFEPITSLPIDPDDDRPIYYSPAHDERHATPNVLAWEEETDAPRPFRPIPNGWDTIEPDPTGLAPNYGTSPGRNPHHQTVAHATAPGALAPVRPIIRRPRLLYPW